MNMFRDILIVALIILGISIGMGNPEKWTWTGNMGSGVSRSGRRLKRLFVSFLAQTRRPILWHCLFYCPLATTLFMTRLKY